MDRNIVIIGGGAAGMVAAIATARTGARVLVCERMQRVGKKLLATGNGRCNWTNRHLSLDRYHGADPGFAAEALRAFGLQRTLAFFEELGIAPREEEDGKIYPASGQASSVLDVLRDEMDRLGVQVACEAAIERVVQEGKGFRCLCGDGRAFPADRVIVAAGGKSYPNLGSNGGGFRIAQALGHRIEPPFPVLVQVKLAVPFLKPLQGVKLDAEATALVDGRPQRAETGEVLFTEYGLSGLPVLQISRVISQHSESGRPLDIRINLFSGATEEEVLSLLRRRFAARPDRTVEFSFVGLLPKRLIPVLLREVGLTDLARPCGELSEAEVRCIAERLRDWRLPCAGTQSWMSAQVTAGGVSTREVDPRTLESRLVPGLYFAGEVLDVDGDSGGYNLQWAWSSGYVAGTHAGGAVQGSV